MVQPFQIILIVVIIAVIALLIILWPKSTAHTATPLTPPSSAPNSTTIPSTTATQAPAAKVQFYDVNVQYVYTGPSSVNNTQCYESTHTYIVGDSATLNGSETFDLQFQPGSGQCPLRVINVSSDTPGFTVLSTTPGLPFSLPPSSNFQLQVNMEAPGVSFYGPLTITIYMN